MRSYGPSSSPTQRRLFGLLLRLPTPRRSWPARLAQRPGTRELAGCVQAVGCRGHRALAGGLLMSWSRGGAGGRAAGVALVVLALGSRSGTPSGSAPAALALVGPESCWPSCRRYLGASSPIRCLLDGSRPHRNEITDANFSVVERVAHWVAWLRMSSVPPGRVGAGHTPSVYPESRCPAAGPPSARPNYYHNVRPKRAFGLAPLGMLWAR
jgi:hypothetical protein